MGVSDTDWEWPRPCDLPSERSRQRQMLGLPMWEPPRRPVFIQDRSASGKRDSSTQRQTAQNRLQARNGLRGDRNATARARHLRASWPSPGNLVVRKSAWWAREDSNLQPHRSVKSAYCASCCCRSLISTSPQSGHTYTWMAGDGPNWGSSRAHCMRALHRRQVFG
jgi:hypothetical protein